MDIHDALAHNREDDALLIKRVLNAISLVYPHADLAVEATESNNILIFIKAEEGAWHIEVTEAFLDANNGLYNPFRHIRDLELELMRLGPGDALLLSETGLKRSSRPRHTRR
jgi:hypothetical protein